MAFSLGQPLFANRAEVASGKAEGSRFGSEALKHFRDVDSFAADLKALFRCATSFTCAPIGYVVGGLGDNVGCEGNDWRHGSFRIERYW